MKTEIIPESRNWPPESDFEQEATERTEIPKVNSLHPAPIEICRPLARAISSAKSALCFLCYLLFKPSRLRPALCALCVVLWQSALAEVRYVDVNSTNATPPYTNWATAATNIQNAVDAAVAGDEIVVTNGTYAPVTVLKPIAMRSINGPQCTIIDGGGRVGCVYLTNSASLYGFTLTNGYSRRGGGVWCGSSSAVVSNCVLTGNSADQVGGGAYYCTLNNCTLTGNSAFSGGGANSCTLIGCMLTGNSAAGTPFSSGGGAAGCTLNNCTLTGNSADGPHASGGGA